MLCFYENWTNYVHGQVVGLLFNLKYNTMMTKKADVKKHRIINIVLFWNGLVMYGRPDEQFSITSWPFSVDLLEYWSYFVEFCVTSDWSSAVVPSITSFFKVVCPCKTYVIFVFVLFKGRLIVQKVLFEVLCTHPVIWLQFFSAHAHSDWHSFP